ncbi:MAG: hypothetical protein QM426_00860 [Euryarchaeota archaeon]|nr:hypothetical protein [Euryarchaeota archaeon]
MNAKQMKSGDFDPDTAETALRITGEAEVINEEYNKISEMLKTAFHYVCFLFLRAGILIFEPVFQNASNLSRSILIKYCL